MQLRNLIRRLRRDNRGTYLVEFAMISLPLATLLMGGVELGYYAYAKSKVEGALREVSRLAATGTSTSEELDTLLNARLDSIKNADIKIERKSYSSFEDVSQPEPLVSDVEPFGGTPGPGDCYLDVNGNEQWDDDMGEDSLGGSEDILFYGIELSYPVFFGITKNIINGGKDTMRIEANAVIKNEPFSNLAQPDPEVECIT